MRITRSMEELAHSFDVGLTDRWSEYADPIPIEAGDACSVFVDGGVVLTGYIDEDRLDYGPEDRSLGFNGRSKTGDLVDCAAIHGKGQWRNVGLLTIAQDLCAPLGITVSAKVSLGEKFGPPDGFKIQEGETVFDCLSRAARARGVLMMTDADGNLVFDRAGTVRVTTKLERGKNILRGSKRNSQESRFSEYTVKTQSSGNDNVSGAATSIKRSSLDVAVGRNRPTVIIGENESNGTELQKRADWERNVRAGRARRLSYVVQGWKHAGGLWEPNTLIRVIDPDARIDDDLLAVTVTQSRDNRGTLTTIDLTLKEAFDVQPLPTVKRKQGSMWP